MAVNVTQISAPLSIPPQDAGLISTNQQPTYFNPTQDYIEFVITTPNGSFQTVDYNYSNYRFPTDNSTTSDATNVLDISPSTDLSKAGFTSGEYNVIYNFLHNELGSSYDNQNLIIKEISADRTELKLRNLGNLNLVGSIDDFKSKLSSNSFYIDNFYLNFGNNNLVAANNIELDLTNFDIIINLVEPLPNSFRINTTLWIVTKVADTLAFNISFTPEVIIPTVTSFSLRGPNLNLPIKDQTNNSTVSTTYSELITSSLLSTPYSQLNNLLSSSGVEVNIDYTNFDNFIYFSSAVQRIKNFTYKVTQISASQAEIDILNSTPGFITSSNITILTNQINNIIENFDGYEYYLYYESSSYAWPKSNSTLPYTLYSPTSTEVINWLGDDNIYSPSYGGILASASLYDNQNVNYLYNTIPEYLRDDPQNEPYKLFVDLAGQFFDNIWIYYKDVTNLYEADNRLDYGISKDLVAEALQSFGVKLYQNNFTTSDLYSAFIGYTSNPDITGSLPVNTGSFQEYINNYVTSSYDASVMPLDDINKEVYKRLYHNLPYLAKTKGTIPGLRALINCFGVPDTILRISEFGGRDKDTSTYDYFDQQFDYAFNSFYDANTGVNYLENQFVLHPSWSANNNRPESIQFRFKTAGLANLQPSQSLLTIDDTAGGGPGGSSARLILLYTGSGYTSASYSGSTPSSSYQFAKLDFYPNATYSPNVTASIYLPFFNEEWWSVMINRSGDTYTLYAGNNLYYDGYDGNQIGYLVSSSVTTSSLSWPSGDYFQLSADGIVNIGSYNCTPFTGSFQELRFWAKTGSVESFKDFIMNPQSIDYTGETNYANYLAHRLPLGADLITTTSSYLLEQILTSVHPKITGSWPTTQSFNSTTYGGPNGTVISISNNPWYVTNVGPRFLNSPTTGLRGRVTDKIQIISGSYPTGGVLSQYTSLEQSYPSLGSESPDVNLLEVAFSPQNEINDDIIDSLGYFNIGEYIGDPRQVSSSATNYPDLNRLSNDFFQKYFDTYDLKDYVRLIKYFDNSLFKMIKDFVPARTSLTSGVVIKQHILERNKYPQPQVEWEELDYSGSIDTAFISGSTGGTFNQYNNTSFAQNWVQIYEGPTGTSYISHSTQDEFYNGELPGTEYVVTDGELNPNNDFKYPTTLEIYYDPTLYLSSITPLSDFLDNNTSPNQGEIYLWYDTGSILQPGGSPIQR